MLRGKLLSVCIATALAIGLPLSIPPRGFVPETNDTKLNGISLNGISLNGISLNGISLNGISLNGISLNGTQSTGATLVETSTQPLRVEGGQLVVQAEAAH